MIFELRSGGSETHREPVSGGGTTTWDWICISPSVVCCKNMNLLLALVLLEPNLSYFKITVDPDQLASVCTQIENICICL